MPPQHVRGTRRPCGTSPLSCAVPMSDHCVVHLVSTLYAIMPCHNTHCMYVGGATSTSSPSTSTASSLSDSTVIRNCQRHASKVFRRHPHSPESHQSSLLKVSLLTRVTSVKSMLTRIMHFYAFLCIFYAFLCIFMHFYAFLCMFLLMLMMFF